MHAVLSSSFSSALGVGASLFTDFLPLFAAVGGLAVLGFVVGLVRRII